MAILEDLSRMSSFVFRSSDRIRVWNRRVDSILCVVFREYMASGTGIVISCGLRESLRTLVVCVCLEVGSENGE